MFEPSQLYALAGALLNNNGVALSAKLPAASIQRRSDARQLQRHEFL